MKQLLREPLVHFLVLGAGLFLLFGLVGGRRGDDPIEITVSADRIAALQETWQRTWMRPPTAEELDGLVEDWIREEVYYREAMAMALDRDDTIVRRRMRQKLEFLTDDLATAAPAGEDELRAYLADHAGQFRLPARYSFEQIYLDLDRRGPAIADDAQRLLARLARGDGGDLAALGDRLSLPNEWSDVPATEVARQFGTVFAEQLEMLPVGSWTGPVESGYGLHLVRMSRRVEPADPAFEDVRATVEREFETVRRAELRDAFYLRLRERYRVTVEGAASGGGEAAAQNADGQQ